MQVNINGTEIVNHTGISLEDIYEGGKYFNDISIIIWYDKSDASELPCWPNVFSVTLASHNLLKVLPNWPNVSWISLVGCISLIKIPNWPSLTSISIVNSNITSLPLWQSINTVSIINCNNLVKLPNWSSLERIDLGKEYLTTNPPTFWPRLKNVCCIISPFQTGIWYSSFPAFLERNRIYYHILMKKVINRWRAKTANPY